MTTIYLSLGSNLGNRENNLLQAVRFLKKEIHIIKVSSFYETKPQDNTKQPYFLNCCIKGETNLKPLELLNFTENIEQLLGRKEKGNFLPRTLDIDILYYGMQNINLNNLTIPHPKICQRSFVLIPLLEIADNNFLKTFNLDLQKINNFLNSKEVNLWKTVNFIRPI